MGQKSDDLASKYRPTKLTEIIGQRKVVGALKNLLDNQWAMPHSFLLQGIAGCGKTTIARITANELGCLAHNIKELSGGSLTGKDELAALITATTYKPIGTPAIRTIIINEAEKLTTEQWDLLYAALEEPPSHTYWFFCTTHIESIPFTIRTRFTPLNLYPVRPERIYERLSYIADKEKFPVSESVLSFISSFCDGSVRSALHYLSLVRTTTDLEDAKNILNALEENLPPVIRLFCKNIKPYILGERSDQQIMEDILAMRSYTPSKICELVEGYWERVIENEVKAGNTEALFIVSDCVLKFFSERPSSWGKFFVILANWMDHIRVVQPSGKSHVKVAGRVLC